MSERPWAQALAEAVGVMPAYHDVAGREHRLDDSSAVALLSAMGRPGDPEDAARAALEQLRRDAERRVLPAAAVLAVNDGEPPVLRIGAPAELGRPITWRATITLESADALALDGEHHEDGDVTVVLEGVPLGYHHVGVTLTGPSGAQDAEAPLIVAPSRCWTTADSISGRGYGIWCNLYSVRSDENWGVGDFGDLRRLVQLAANAGAAFVGVNPLHALRNRGTEISPYSPVSRLFRNPIYISVPDLPEFAESVEAQALVGSDGIASELRELRGASIIDYDRVRVLKERVLRVLFREFCARHRNRGTTRGGAFTDYVAREGRALDGFATFLALEAHLSRDGTPVYWREWPEEYRDPGSAAVARFREQHADELDWHRWIQFELDRQLGAAAALAAESGMPIGLYQDLAVGTSEGGSDVWAFQHLFDRGVTVGAPPDEYAAQGQDWGLPPLDPNRLRDDGYRYWIRLVRSAFRHAGALRIDHAMGLTRLYWIPPGLPATEGAYVRYPAEDLLAILALESRRHQAVVIAEDLGTVPEGFEALLERWGILSSRVLWFEREEGGGFRSQTQYIERALVTTTTHDHAPLAAWLTARDAEVRRTIGVMSDEQAAEAVAWRERERIALMVRLQEAELIAPGAEDPPYPTMLAAVYGYIAGTPARLVGVSLDDLAGETDPVNIPGVGPDRYPAWSRRMRTTVDELAQDDATARALEAVRTATQER